MIYRYRQMNYQYRKKWFTDIGNSFADIGKSTLFPDIGKSFTDIGKYIDLLIRTY